MFGVPHAMFSIESPPIRGGTPPDRDLARRLRHACLGAGATCSRVELWRGLGWVFSGQAAGREFEVYFSRYPNGRTLLAVAPLEANGFLARVFGTGRPARDGDLLFTLCEAIHAHLSTRKDVTDLRWTVGSSLERPHQFPTPRQFPWPTAV